MKSLTYVMCMGGREKGGGGMERDVWETYGKGWN